MLPTSLINLLPIAIAFGGPLVCVTIIARRMGRGRIVTNLPWALAVVLTLAWLSLLVLPGNSQGSVAQMLPGATALGGFISLFVSLIVLACVGVKRDRMAPVEAF